MRNFYNSPIVSIGKFKKYINRRFDHDLKFVEVKNDRYKSHSLEEWNEDYKIYNLRKNQTNYHSSTIYTFVCRRCMIYIDLYIQKRFGVSKGNKTYEFINKERDLDIIRYKCDDFLIKSILE